MSNNLEIFEEWFKENNGKLSLKLNQNRVVLSTKFIKKDENVLEIPKELLIISSNYDNEKLSNFSKLLLLTFNYWKSEKFKKYFNIIPKEFNDFPIYWSEEKIESIKNTFIYKEILEKKI